MLFCSTTSLSLFLLSWEQACHGCGASILQRGLVESEAVAVFLFMSQDAALPTEQIHLSARASGHLLEHGGRVRTRSCAKLDLVGGELSALGSDEPLVVEVFITCILTNSVEGLADVHVDVG